MPESIDLVWYELQTDSNTYKVTESQKEIILKASQGNVRFVDIGDAVINLAFIREMRRVEIRRGLLDRIPLDNEEKKYIVSKQNDKQLPSSN